MKVFFVKNPYQHKSQLDKVEKFEEVQYSWCVKTFQYTKKNGGIRQFFDMIKKIKPDIIFFYNIKSQIYRLPDGSSDIIYYIRLDLQTNI